ncbi:RNA-dependent DNA polymerase, partial [Staphylococcus equorum]|uniref:RNA-directed DNA polymerase n=1 Tax=Staphylococcus equorum TaxID=246432 RepID=UPI000D493870
VESKYVDNEDLENYYGNPENFYLKLLSLQDLYKLLETEDLRVFFNFENVRHNVDTEPIYFNIPKSNYVRREYKMPNLYSYLHLSFFIEDNKEEFISIFENNVQSTSKYFNELEFNFKFTKKIEQRLLFGGNNILSLDLSNFYHTLYTHSIPWVIHGKQNSKLKRSGGFANNLDSLIQKCQYGETHGIPTGNIISKLIAELYMCYIDKMLMEKGYKYARYV